MLESLAQSVVVFTAIYLIGIAVASFIAPKLAAKFLDAFASSARAHLAEMATRLLVGWALLVYSPYMLYSYAFKLFGSVLVVTSVLLLLIPWRWHHKFAQVAVRPMTRHVWLFGLFSLPLASVILYAVLGRSVT